MEIEINKTQDGLRQGPTNNKFKILKDTDMASVLMRLFPDFTLPDKQAYLRINGRMALTQSGHRVQPDFIYAPLRLIVEVDGQNLRVGHYTNAKQCVDDIEKDEVYKNNGWKVIRIPAYIQLDKEMIEFFFGIKYDKPLYTMCREHGFLHSQIDLPANFCTLGLNRFYREMDGYPVNVRKQVLETLVQRIRQYENEGYSHEHARKMVIPDDFKYSKIMSI